VATLPARSLTQKQRTVLDFVQRYFGEYRCSPLIREIQAGCQILSYKSALDRLNALERKGFIRRLSNKHRGIRLVRKALVEAFASAPLPTAGPAAATNTGEGVGV
jgi:repressor LexA